MSDLIAFVKKFHDTLKCKNCGLQTTPNFGTHGPFCTICKGKYHYSIKNGWKNFETAFTMADLRRFADGRVPGVLNDLANKRCEKADFTLVSSEGKRVGCHRSVMEIRSSVLGTMCHWNREKSEETFEYGEISLKALVNYLYTDELPVPIAADTAMDTLIMGEKYELPALKRLSEEVLAKAITVKTAIKWFHLSELHEADVLKVSCIHFIVRNLNEMKKTNDWQELKTNKPQVLIQIMEANPLGF